MFQINPTFLDFVAYHKKVLSGMDSPHSLQGFLTLRYLLILIASLFQVSVMLLLSSQENLKGSPVHQLKLETKKEFPHLQNWLTNV